MTSCVVKTNVVCVEYKCYRELFLVGNASLFQKLFKYSKTSRTIVPKGVGALEGISVGFGVGIAVGN